MRTVSAVMFLEFNSSNYIIYHQYSTLVRLHCLTDAEELYLFHSKLEHSQTQSQRYFFFEDLTTFVVVVGTVWYYPHTAGAVVEVLGNARA